MHSPHVLKSAKPLLDRVLIRPDPVEEKMGSILMPDHLQSRPRRGTVLAVGPGRYDAEGALVPMGLKGGERVVFARSRWTGRSCSSSATATSTPR